MRAAVCTGYGPPEVLQLREVGTPVPARRRGPRQDPRDDRHVERLVRPERRPDAAARQSGHDAPGRRHRRPRRAVLGMVQAGEVEQVGRAVGRFRVGDRVYAFTKYHFGAYAGYATMAETSTIAGAPANLTFERVGRHPVRRSARPPVPAQGPDRERAGVLVYGASGAVGTSAVRLARPFRGGCHRGVRRLEPGAGAVPGGR